MLVTAATAVLAAVALIFSLYMAGREPLLAGDFPIDSQLYRYFLDSVRAAPKNFGLVDGSPESAIREETNKLVAEFAVVEKMFDESGLSLANSAKLDLSENLNNRWLVFGNYYQKIGVSKQTLYRTFANSAKRDALFASVYGAEGTKAISEADLLKAFNDNFVTFRAFSDTFRTPDGSGNISDQEKKNLQTRFNNMLSQTQSGKDLDTIFSSYIDFENQHLPMQILEKNEQAGFGTDFFAKVQKIPHGDVAVIESGSDIHLLQREGEITTDSEYFLQYRLITLKILKGGEFNKQIADDAAALELVHRETVQRRDARAVL
ncbi:MAG: hypothetical protein FWG82_05330 [Oscillospiraceae bacterium]|nr:hypothetical protein [Oscillospiraceae bacterium]